MDYRKEWNQTNQPILAPAPTRQYDAPANLMANQTGQYTQTPDTPPVPSTVRGRLTEQMQLLDGLNGVIDMLEQSLDPVLHAQPVAAGGASTAPADPRSVVDVIQLSNRRIDWCLGRLSDIIQRLQL